MWSSVVAGVAGSDTPCARHKHAACSAYPFVYLFGGRQGNLPLKDFWIYDLGSRTWRQECEDKGTRPPPLQQHTMVASHGKIFVFGGELCMSNETPLWIYEIQRRQWRKWCSPLDRAGGSHGRKSPGGRNGPVGRRGHISVVIDDQIIVYGGYQDLQGSTGEMWAFNIKEECWRLIPARGEQPPPRHNHSAVVHDKEIWVYGGMTDLVERGDFWKYDPSLRTWTQIRNRPNPSLLHSHVAVKLHSSMIVFGGERHGEILNDLWRFHFATSMWEKLVPAGAKPQPRSQSCAFIAPSLTSKPFRFNVGYSSLGGASSSSGSSSSSSGYGSSYGMSRANENRYKNVHHLKDRSSGGYQNRTCDCPECSDDSDIELESGRLKSMINKHCASTQVQPSIKMSISKISNLNLNHLGKYYNYNMLDNDSTESILDDSRASTCDSTVSKLIKSQSNLGFKDIDRVDFSKESLPRDISSVPDFVELQDQSDEFLSSSQTKLINVLPASEENTANFLEDSFEVDWELKGRLALQSIENGRSVDAVSNDNLISFSETSSTPNNTATSDKLSSFDNPNYIGFGKENQGLLTKDYWTNAALDLESVRHKEFAEVLRTPPDSGIGLCVEMESRTPFDVALATLEDFVSFDKKNPHPLSPRFPAKRETSNLTPIECMLRKPSHEQGNFERRGHNTARVTFCTDLESTPKPSSCGISTKDKNEVTSHKRRSNPFLKTDPPPIPEGPEAMYVLGGKEIGELTVFRRPISIWKLDLPY